MTRILLHPRELPPLRYGGGDRRLLARPWGWWQARFYGQHAEVVSRYEPAMDAIEECSITFGADQDRVILTDPPAAVLMNMQDYEPIHGSSFGDVSRVVLARSWLEARVVWHESPGAAWQPLGLPSCRPGDYRHDTNYRHDIERAGDREEFLPLPMELLVWPRRPTIVDGVALPPRNFPDRCRQCERYIPVEAASGRELISGVCDECRAMAMRRFDEMRELTRQEIAAVYGIPIQLAATMTQEELRQRILADNEAEGFRREQLNQWVSSDDRALTPNEIRRREGLQPAPPGEIQQIRSQRLGYARTSTTWRAGPGRALDPPTEVDLARFRERDRFYPGDPRNPEQDVLDAIEELVNEQLTHPEDFHQMGDQSRCPHCGGHWHGLPGDGPPALVAEGVPGAESYRQVGNGGEYGCPGSTADAKAVRKWRKQRKGK